MKKSIAYHCLFAVLLCAGLFTSFGGLAQGARMLPKGGSEISFGYMGITSFEEDAGLLSLPGAGFGFGVTDKVNLKVRYSRVLVSDLDGGINIVSFTPKFAIVQDKVAASLPISVLFAEGDAIWAVSPGIQFSAGKTNTTEFTLDVKGDIPFTDELDGALLSAELGGGFSRDLDRWAIRPKVGVLFSTDGGDPAFSFGLGVHFALNAPKG